MNNRWKSIAATLLILFAAAVLYRKATRLWWMYDDAYLLRVVISWSPADYFGRTAFWRSTPSVTFFPLLLAMYDALLGLFGLNAAAFHVAQVALIGLAAVTFYFVLRLYRSPEASAGGALLFLCGPAICTLATQTMLLHYLETIILGCLATLAFVHALRRSSLTLTALSVALYFAAMLAKEISVPLVGLLLILPERELRTRVRFLAGHFVAFAAYGACRWIALGTPLGGYGWAIEARDVPRLIATLPWKLAGLWIGAGGAVGLAMLAVMVAVGAPALRGRRQVFVTAAAFVLAVGPVMPMSKVMEPRYALASWLWLCVLFAIGVERLRGRIAVIAAALLLAVVANRQEWRREFARSARMSDEGRVWMELGSGAVLRRPAVPPAAMEGLRWLKEEHLQGRRGASWFYDDIFLCGMPLEAKQFFEYDPKRRAVVDITARIPRIARAHCLSIRETAPLRAEFHHRGQSLFWRFGPYQSGTWRVVIGSGLQAFELPMESGFRLPGVHSISLRVRYDSPEGWVTYSPEISLDFNHHPDSVWSR